MHMILHMVSLRFKVGRIFILVKEVKVIQFERMIDLQIYISISIVMDVIKRV